MTFHQNWLLSRPQQSAKCLFISRPLCFTSKLTPFKTLVFYSDLLSSKTSCHKLTPFKTLMFLHPIWTPFKTITCKLLDPNWLISRPSCCGLSWNITQLTHFKTLILVYYSVSISMGDYLQNLNGRLPSETSINLQNTLHSELDFFMKQRRKTHHMQVINTFQHPDNTFYTRHQQYSSKLHSFQDPRNFTSTVHSSIHLKTLSSLTPTQDKDTVTSSYHKFVHNSLVTLSSLRAHYIP